MKNSSLASVFRRARLTALGIIAISIGMTRAQAADTYVFQWDDAETALTANTYVNGVLIQSVTIGNESYGHDYGLLGDGRLLANINVAVNIFDTNGVTLSDTWHIFGNQGDSRINIPFASEFEGNTVQPLATDFRLIENGNYQTVTEFDDSNGNHWIWQFRSDVDSVPDTGTTASLLGLALMGLSFLRRKLC